MTSPDDPPVGWAGLVSAALVVAMGVLFSVVHTVAGDPHSPEGWLQHLSFGLPLIAAGAVAGVGATRGAPWLTVAGGLAAAPIAVVSIIGLPVLVLAGVLVAAGVRRLERPLLREVVAGVGVVVLLVSAFFYEVLHQDPAAWTTPDGGGSSSNVITTTESLVVLVAVGLALALAFGSRATRHPTIRTIQRVGG